LRQQPELEPVEDLKIQRDGHVVTITLGRPPHNYFDEDLIAKLATAFEHFDEDPECRTLVLAAEGKSFCAGADFIDASTRDPMTPARIYAHAVRLFRTRKPVVAAIHGPAIGGGLGLALVADFRVTSEDARFSANFTRLGIHPGFGLSVTLERVVGAQQAARLLYTGRRISGAEAVEIGLADLLVPTGEVLAAAIALAHEIAASAPLALMSTRATLRADLAKQVTEAVAHEAAEQRWQVQTSDFAEGVAATAARRPAIFTGK
jgi:enoyl-CoA hydratase/carnithine racemase